MVVERMVGGLTRLEWLQFLGIESANAPILAAIAALSWPGNGGEVLTVLPTEDGFEFAPAAVPAFRGALVRKASNQTGADFTTRTALTWDSEGGSCYDTSAFHDTSSNTDRLTIPSGVTKVRLKGQLQITSLTADLWARLSLEKNGSLDFDGVAQANTEVGNTTVTLNLSSAVLAVTAGDYFKLTLVVETDTAIDITAARSWFSIEAVE